MYYSGKLLAITSDCAETGMVKGSTHIKMCVHWTRGSGTKDSLFTSHTVEPFYNSQVAEILKGVEPIFGM